MNTLSESVEFTSSNNFINYINKRPHLKLLKLEGKNKINFNELAFQKEKNKKFLMDFSMRGLYSTKNNDNKKKLKSIFSPNSMKKNK